MRSKARMRKVKLGRLGSRLTLLLALPLLVLSCDFVGNLDEANDGNSLLLSFVSPVSRTLVPPVSMVPVTYQVSGIGPGGLVFSAATTSTTLVQKNLKKGTWTITVSALNAAAAQIALGGGTVEITGTARATLAVTINPLAGTGTLQVGVTWNAAGVPAAAVDARLLPMSGAAIPLAVTLQAGSASCTAAAVPAGYYTLSVQLMSGTQHVTGAVEVARIVAGQTTSGSYDFTQAAVSGGSLVIGFTPVTANPLTVSLSGQVVTLTVGASMTVTAAVSGTSGNVTYVWYLNGQNIATGSSANPSLILGAGLAAGVYRLDVAAFSADGLRAGATTCAFSIL
jgi:hypothetical protein